MKITVLIENTSKEGLSLKAEKGLSLLIETKGKKILFDTGVSGNFIDNADDMKVDLGDIDCCVISHGHYDHGNGLPRLMSKYPKLKVHIVEKGLFKNYHNERHIGLSAEAKESIKGKTSFVKGRTQLFNNVFLLQGFVENPSWYSSHDFFIEVNGKKQDDDFSHEATMVVVEDSKCYVISGCSHEGIVNIVEMVKKEFSKNELTTLVGGLHFIDFSKESEKKEIIKITNSLCDIGLKRIITGHCTGVSGYNILKENASCDVEYLSGGSVFEI